MTARLAALACVMLLAVSRAAQAFTPEAALAMAGGDNDSRIQAMNEAVMAGDVAALAFLEKLQNDAVKVTPGAAFVIDGDKALDPVAGQAVTLPADAEDVVNSNRMRREIDGAISALKLASPDAAVRLEAAHALQGADLDESRLPLIEAAEAREPDAAVRDVLVQLRAGLQLQSPDAAVRLAAVKALAASGSPSVREMLSSRLAAGGEADPDIRGAIEAAVAAIDRSLKGYEYAGLVFTGISLGSILLLAALGLAITYGLMGIINMAHGELMMIGAYATYLVQNLFRAYLPDWFQWYLLAAVPVAFVAAGLVGMVIERTVLRFLYGRALETLLATWGISLVLMQGVRSLFGAQNVQVENPVWMSGNIAVAANLALPYNRLVIIAFSVAVMVLMWWLLTRTRLGLFVRAVTQNRTMASCVGVPTRRVDTLAFGLGSAIAGVAGVALSQIGNVGPDLGQQYIVNSFMVVVLGGVGQLAGAVFAAIGVGVVAKFMETLTGAVLAQIMVLVFVIIFIQKRPQGLFALSGRSAEA